MTELLMGATQYIAIGVVVALVLAAWDNGKWLSTSKYLFVGAIWPLSSVLVLSLVIYKFFRHKVINR